MYERGRERVSKESIVSRDVKPPPSSFPTWSVQTQHAKYIFHPLLGVLRNFFQDARCIWLLLQNALSTVTKLKDFQHKRRLLGRERESKIACSFTKSVNQYSRCVQSCTEIRLSPICLHYCRSFYEALQMRDAAKGVEYALFRQHITQAACLSRNCQSASGFLDSAHVFYCINQRKTLLSGKEWLDQTVFRF